MDQLKNVKSENPSGCVSSALFDVEILKAVTLETETREKLSRRYIYVCQAMDSSSTLRFGLRPGSAGRAPWPDSYSPNHGR